MTPSHHFPLGIIMPVSRRSALLSWAAGASDRYILEDDYDSEFRFSGRPIPALQSLDRNERVIYLNTFAKTLAPSLRISYMVLPPHLLERWRRELWFYSSTVPSFEQDTLALFMQRGHFERHLARARNRYKAGGKRCAPPPRKPGCWTSAGFPAGMPGCTSSYGWRDATRRNWCAGPPKPASGSHRFPPMIWPLLPLGGRLR